MTEKKSLLIIDDEGDIAEILATLLEDEFECEYVVSGEEGLNKIQTNQYSAIITDLEMPDISGINIIKTVRENNDNIPIFISTGHDHAHPKVQTALSIGAQAALHKPFLDPDDLIATLKPHLG
ncbi:response regulator transcription factor [Pseudobacteriovorax antillogorgiicola]|uniref:Two-component system, chemotaxis family, response regulator CheY n=1 Tax=Pseudobacteriovorax antillogorgiicola TaxID=1513793 RepID=A0A1Y6C6R0_9BACT|nr:response regulator [Pseudobacteriovorax antillogorgiicola]TCS49479.1 two-component system chemotaxis response regulator CheY [Pseudobacteriovorax antillogorgiicola]SMF46128.1 two-component system, chemotaxis family, response regulator CheY [Pseudobacteriovorax antillogorgiicola]